MKTVKVKRKKGEDEKKDVVGIIVGIMLLLILLAGGYYMVDMFKGREVTADALAGDWKIPTQPGEKVIEHWAFDIPSDPNVTATGTARHFKINADTGEYVGDVEKYSYEIVLEEGKTQPKIFFTQMDVRREDMQTWVFQVTSLSKAQMSAFIGTASVNASKTTRLTKPLF
jgi:hypothetical protein